MIVRMQMNGDFWDEASGVELTTELYSHDVDHAAQSTPEYESQRLIVCNEAVKDFQQELTGMLMN